MQGGKDTEQSQEGKSTSLHVPLIKRQWIVVVVVALRKCAIPKRAPIQKAKHTQAWEGKRVL